MCRVLCEDKIHISKNHKKHHDFVETHLRYSDQTEEMGISVISFATWQFLQVEFQWKPARI